MAARDPSQVKLGRMLWLSGPLSAALFTLSLFCFAAARTDGYSHATKAVSELGAVGAPMATAFNILGFILPGALIALLATQLLRTTGAKLGPTLLAVSGCAMVVAGVFPADMTDLQSFTSLAHLGGAMLSGFAWAAALLFLGKPLRETFALKRWSRLTPWFSLFLFANIAWQVAFQVTGAVLPGWGQRIGFFGLFLWVGICGYLIWRKSERATNAA